MSKKIIDDLVNEIGRLILQDKEYSADLWTSIALIGNISPGVMSMTGYQYLEGDQFSPAVPFNDTILDKMQNLKEEMKKINGTEWHQCLVTISKPDINLNIQFEYEDPNRWSLKAKSLDVSEFALSLRPEN